MTFNELFSKIGNAFGNFFNYLGNTPIEDLFANLGWIIFTIIILPIISRAEKKIQFTLKKKYHARKIFTIV